MDFGFSQEEEEWRQEVREWLRKELPPDWVGGPWSAEPEEETEEGWKFAREFSHKLAQKGWLTLRWPKEYGGGGESLWKDVILKEEIGRVNAPLVDIYGPNMVGPTLMLFGTEQQKKEHLERIRKGEVIWTQGFSEPDAGSDLANLKTRAVEDKDGYIINGQKVWTSIAHHADWTFLLARTGSPELKRSKGISMFLFSMKTPGITWKPLKNIAGHSTFNEVFFDNVLVPKDNLIGKKDQGWVVAQATLGMERSGAVARMAMHIARLGTLVEYARERKQCGEAIRNEAVIIDRIAELAIELDIWRLLIYKVVDVQTKGKRLTYEGGLAGIFGKLLCKRIAVVEMQVLGLYGQLSKNSKLRRLGGLPEQHYLYIPAHGLAGGSIEVLKNLTATYGLDLPRGW